MILQRNSGRNILTYPGTIFDLKMEDLDLAYLADSRHFHFSSFYLQRGLRGQAAQLFQKLKAAGLTISLDTNDDPEDLWQEGLAEALATWIFFFPMRAKPERLPRTNDLGAAMHRLAETVPLVVVKDGMNGALAQQGQQNFSCPALKVAAVDAVGAGDSFDAGFLFEYLRGADIPSCLAMGNLCGAFSTTRSGGTEAFRDREYREQFFRKHRAV